LTGACHRNICMLPRVGGDCLAILCLMCYEDRTSREAEVWLGHH